MKTWELKNQIEKKIQKLSEDLNKIQKNGKVEAFIQGELAELNWVLGVMESDPSGQEI